MKKRASEIYFSGDFNYANIIVHPDGVHEITFITKDGKIVKIKVRYPPRGPPQVIEDSTVEV